jgi:HEAT repeat protein
MASSIRAGEEPLDSLMYHDPELPKPKIAKVFGPDLIDAWLLALRRTEADYQCRAALTIALAHQEGMKGLEVTIDPLVEILERPDHHALARLAAARALVELDARQAAPSMLRQAETGDHDLRDLIEPALASWKYREARDFWLKRLSQPDAPSGDLVLAIRGLVALGASEAASRLVELVDSDQVSWPIRLEAARALGVIQMSGLESQAKRLMESGDGAKIGADSNSRLAAAWLLAHHQGDQAIRLLQALARDPEPAVASVSLQRLLEIDSKLVLPALDPMLASPDAKMRSLGIETLFREASIERLRLLGDKLEDPHPEVRVKARHALEDLAGAGAEDGKEKWRETVIEQGRRIMAGQNWRGLEQAIIFLARLKDKPSAKRVAELLDFERPEVLITAAWGLRYLAVPETLPAALKRFQEIQGRTKSYQKITKSVYGWDMQLSHLAQFMGQSRYQPADAALRQEVPRERNEVADIPAVGQETRAASIWALGFIHDDKPDAALIKEIEARLNDTARPFHPAEDTRVRYMSAISLARMKSKESLPSLRHFRATAKPTLDPVAHACSWAIQQLTGEPPPAPGTVEVSAGTFKNWLRSLPPKSKPAE